MNYKILGIIVIVIIAISCLTIVSADNNTTDTPEITNEETVIEDNTNYILATSISNNIIKFSDGFTGFPIDSSKASITAEDKFTSEPSGSSQIENYIKLAIIECYKQNRENDIGKIVSSFVDGSYQSSGDEIINAILNSGKTIGDNEITDIDNTTEATFNFELLKSADDEKSDCIAYTVSFKKVASEEKLAASDDNEQTSGEDVATTKENSDNPTTAEENKTTTDKTEDKSDENTTAEENKTTNDNTGETVINETNKTIINKTNTVIVNQNNTTIITQKNIKHINNTTKEPVKNTPIEEKIMKTVGNPIFLLIVVIAIIAIVAVVIRRKD